MSGGGIKRAQDLHGEQFVRKRIDSELIVIVNKTRRGVILDELSDSESKKLRRELIPIVESIEICRENIYNDDFDVTEKMKSVIDEDTRDLLKSIDYYMAGDYGPKKVGETVRKL